MNQKYEPRFQPADVKLLKKEYEELTGKRFYTRKERKTSCTTTKTSATLTTA